MCGLTGGFSNVLTVNTTECIRQLAGLSNVRGDESTGAIFGMHMRVKKGKPKGTGKKYLSKKRLGNGWDFFKQEKNHNAMWSPETFLIATHTRLATKGAITTENAHPFHHKHIIGMHNGTVGAYTPIGKDAGGTDSEAIIKDIAERGILPVVEKAKNGAYALVWINTNTNKLHLIRNKERSLWIMHSKNGDTVLWASEKRMLDFVAMSHVHPTWDEPFLMETEILYTYDLPTVKKPTVTSFRQVKVKDTRAVGNDNKTHNVVPFVGGRGPNHGITDYFERRKKREQEQQERMSEEERLTRALEGLTTVQDLFPDERPDLEAQIDQAKEAVKAEQVEVYRGQFRSNTWVAHVLSCGCSNCGAIVDSPDECNFVSNSVSNDWFCDDCATDPDLDIKQLNLSFHEKAIKK